MLQNRHSPAALGAAYDLVRSNNQIARAPALKTKEWLSTRGWPFLAVLPVVHLRGDATACQCAHESRVNGAVQAIGISSQRMIRRRYQAVGQRLIMENGSAAARAAHQRALGTRPVGFAAPMALEIPER